MTKIRIQAPFNKADRRFIDQLLRDELPVVDHRIRPGLDRQVPASSGNVRNLVDNPRYQAKRLARYGGGHNPTPPAPAAAIRVA